jgi:hypothetical protein
VEGDSIGATSYDEGVNNDRYAIWRNSGNIGWVQLAFKVVTEAIYDLILGTRDDMISASVFFYGDEDESLYWLWAEVLGYTELPEIVERHRIGYVTEEDAENIRKLCTVVKTI